jgi:hypothetical protein
LPHWLWNAANACPAVCKNKADFKAILNVLKNRVANWDRDVLTCPQEPVQDTRNKAQSSAEAVASAYRQFNRDYHREIYNREAEIPAVVSREQEAKYGELSNALRGSEQELEGLRQQPVQAKAHLLVA